MSPMRFRGSTTTFEFEIDHFESKYLPAGTCISSPTFTYGGYDWALDYYPRGDKPENESHGSIVLVLKTEPDSVNVNVNVNVNVEYFFQLVTKRGKFDTIVIGYDTFSASGHDSFRGYEKFITRNKIENFYCKNGILVLSCNIRVFAEQVVVNNSGGLCEHIGKLWEKRERFDVTFEVEGESISAHRLILAARSPVFEATLFGPMAEANMERIKIDEMKAEVFDALLHFVYTDELAINEHSDDERDSETLSVELLQGLLVAANRYALDKLTLLCEKQLSKKLSVDIVATTLILADQHSRTWLKMKCLDFASSPKNFSLVALTEGYLQIMQGCPALFAELSEKVKGSPPFMYNLAKKQKTC